MPLYNSGLYGSDLYGLTAEEVTGFTVTDPSIGDTLDLSWINPTYDAFGGTIILRSASTISDKPVDETSYSVGNFIGSAEVVFIGNSSQTSFRDTGRTDHQTYYYRIFTFTTPIFYTIIGVEDSGASTDSVVNPASNFVVQDQHKEGKLFLYWDNPLDSDLEGVKVLRRTDRSPLNITDGDLIFDGSASSFMDDTVDNYKIYYYSIFTYDEVPNYSAAISAHNKTSIFFQQYLSIPTEVTNFQIDVDKERTILLWDSIERSYSTNTLSVSGNEIALSLAITSNDLTSENSATTTFTIGSTGGLSTTDDIYNGINTVLLSGRNIIGRTKEISSYTYDEPPVFAIDKVEYPNELNEYRFGLSSVQNLIDDANIYTDSNIAYNGVNTKVSTYNSSTKTFTLESSASMPPSEQVVLSTAYYPRLYTSKDSGATYDDGVNITYTAGTSAIPVVLNNASYYNSFTIADSDLLNTTDPNFYKGYYATFITGKNKGFSRKVLDFNPSTKKITTEYFDFAITKFDVFSINCYSIPLVSGIEDYRFQIRLWNNDDSNPIYSSPTLGYPSKSLGEYLTALDQGYWDTDLSTNLYTTVQGICQGGQGKAIAEAKFQREDFSVEKVRPIKLYNNFGKVLSLEKNPNISFSIYRKRVFDVLQGLKNGSSYEGLFNIVRAFTSVTPSTEFLTAAGWRLGERRLGSANNITSTTVVSGDSSAPYNTFTIASTGTFSNTDFVSFTNAPSGTGFDLNLIGKQLPIKSFIAGSPNTITIDGVGTPVASGSNIDIFSPDTLTDYDTRPYSNLAYLFGVRIVVYGPLMDDTDKEALNILLAKVIPVHVKYFVVYSTDFYGESSLGGFYGNSIALERDYEYNTLVPKESELLEYGAHTDNINLSITSVVDSSNTFAVSGSTLVDNYYKNKYVKFITGNNIGISREVISYINYNNNFITEDFPYVIQNGDQFQIEKLSYQTRYIAESVDLSTSDFGTTTYTASWYVRKVDPDIEEEVYIEFSEDDLVFSSPRKITQNEILNELVSGQVVIGTSTSVFTGVGGVNSELSGTPSYYVERTIKFLTGNNAGTSKKILAYNEATGSFTTEEFDHIPQTDDTFLIIITDMKRFFRMSIYHNNLKDKNDIEIESMSIKVL